MTWPVQCLAQRRFKRNMQRKDRNRQETKNFSFRLSFIYLVNGLTNATSKDIAWCPKHQIVKTVLSVQRHYPKRERFTENLSIYLFSPAPNSPLQNSSNFGATASHWLLYILLFFFFLILTGWMRGDAFIYFVYFFFLVCPANPLFFAKRLYWFLIVLFSRRIIYQILVSYLQMFNNFGNLFRWLEN